MWKRVLAWIGKKLIEAAIEELSDQKREKTLATVGELAQKAERNKVGKSVQ